MNNLLQVDENMQYGTIFCCPHCSRLSTILNNIVKPESGVTILFNTVNSLEQCGQQNVVQYCFHQLGTSCSFFAVYNPYHVHPDAPSHLLYVHVPIDFGQTVD